jgi:hypothetical protein
VFFHFDLYRQRYSKKKCQKTQKYENAKIQKWCFEEKLIFEKNFGKRGKYFVYTSGMNQSKA